MVMAFALVLAGCQQPSSGGDSGSVAVDWSKAAVGDIVMTDGTFVTAASFTDEMKDKAAAVIVRAKNGSTPALGVGIYHGTSLAWCTNDANAYNVNITDLQSDNCKDGSDGWSILKAALGEKDDTEEASTKYPAWNFCNTYAAKYKLTGDLAKGWYLPALAELKTIYDNKSTIDASLKTAGGDQFGTSWYWSCCQSSSVEDDAYRLGFNGGDTNDYDEDASSYVCSVRAFN